VGDARLIQITPQMRLLVAIEPVDGRKGIDSLAVCSSFVAAAERRPDIDSHCIGLAELFFGLRLTEVACT